MRAVTMSGTKAHKWEPFFADPSPRGDRMRSACGLTQAKGCLREVGGHFPSCPKCYPKPI